MSLMEKGFWVAAGGLAGLVVGCMLFDDVELEPSRTSRRLAKGSQREITEDDEIESEQTATADRFYTSADDDSAADAHAQDIKATMDKIGASLDEALESLKPKAVEPEEA